MTALRDPRSAPRATRLLSLALAAAMVTACSGESSDTPPEGSAPPPAAAPEGVYGVAPAASGGTPSVVTLTPTGAGTAEAPARPTPIMDQLGLAFTPGFMIVRQGETVSFTNSETIAHNVHVRFSDTDSTVLAYDTDPGGRIDLPMEVEGGYEVTCDLHPGMRAFIYVTAAPHAVFAENDGSFVVPGVPPGSYAFSIWNVDPTRRSSRTVEVTGPSTEVR